MEPPAESWANSDLGGGAGESALDRRHQSDRRQTPTSPWGAFPPAGLRTRHRRAEEHRRQYFVDRFSWILFLFILLIVVGSVVDAIFTIELIDVGASEINPFLNRVLDRGALPFVIVKYVLTVVGLPVLLIFKNHYLFHSRFRVGYLLPLIVGLYALLIGYQLGLMQRHFGS